MRLKFISYLNPTLFEAILWSSLFTHIPLPRVIVSPPFLTLHLPSPSPRWGGSSEASSSPWTDPSGTPSCSCGTSAHWTPIPIWSRRRFRRWGGCCPARGQSSRDWWSWRRGMNLYIFLLVVPKGQSLGQRRWLLFHSFSLAGTPSTMGSFLSSWTSGWGLRCKTRRWQSVKWPKPLGKCFVFFFLLAVLRYLQTF